jgi:hypothetical protein
MLTKRLVILGMIAILPAFAQVSNAPTSMEKLAHRQHGPIKNRVEHEDGTSTSDNWSGYAVLGSGFTSVENSWIVPAVACSSGDLYASFWVGIDGYNNDTVEQTGTDSDCVGSTPNYYAWYEFYPQDCFEIEMTIKPGDHMAAKVLYNGTGFSVMIQNVTRGKSFSKSGTLASALRASAEWIAEAPCCTTLGGILPLADFSTVLFGDDNTGIKGTGYAKDGAQNVPIGSFSTIEAITMALNGGATEAVPSGLSSDGSSFSVTWVSQ